MKTKRIISLLLALTLICALCAVGASAKIVTEWRTMYDWESAYASGIVTTENTDGQNLYIRSDLGNQVYKGAGYEGSTSSLKFTGSGVIYNPDARTVARWMKVKLTYDVKIAEDIRFPFYCTNDGVGFGYYGIQTSDSVKQKALDFCSQIRAKYPSCTIVWLDGMMGHYNGTYSTGVKNAMSSITDAYYCYLPGDWSGVDTHPNVAGHQNAANTLYNFLVENDIVE